MTAIVVLVLMQEILSLIHHYEATLVENFGQHKVWSAETDNKMLCLRSLQ